MPAPQPAARTPFVNLETPVETQFRSGFASIIGRPNVGKSTLMNALLRQKLSIVTHKAQTTRNRIVGVHTELERGQIAFVDTPGIHRGQRKLNAAMTRAAIATIGDTDALVFVVEAESVVRKPGMPLWGGDAEIAERVAEFEEQLIIVINKVDLLKDKTKLLPALGALAARFPKAELIPCSASKSNNIDPIMDAIFRRLPEGPLLFPEDTVSNRAERFFASELVREQILLQLHDEIPYGVAITVDDFYTNKDTGHIEIRVIIHVERDSQKGIVIGKGGSRLKEIGTRARAELETFFDHKVHLETMVRVSAQWADSRGKLAEFGYEDDSI